ncbi:hypothetical protein F4604DRAFT_1925517 [Suillus subluteus]|nr:hypothetical protein F4604DRAFT_1925517 [Suillus subluteus]
MAFGGDLLEDDLLEDIFTAMYQSHRYPFPQFSEMEENGLELRQRPVPPPSRPFHVVVAPGQAKKGLKCAKQGPYPPDLHYPLNPHRQTPGPIPTSQTYLRTLVLECWNAELRHCDEACKAQISERMQGPLTHQTYVRELIIGHWNAEKKKCEEARKVQLLEILLASHGITTLV